ncbi:MAG: DUF4012 domain-containing protein [Acidimicrobiia bacterium]
MVASVVLVLALAVVDLLRVRAAVADAQDKLFAFDPSRADTPGGVSAGVDAARDALREADSRARDSLWLRALSVVPGAGAQVAAIRDLTGTAVRLGELTADSVGPLDDAVQRAGSSPAGRVELLDATLGVIDQLRSGLGAIAAPDRVGLLPPLAGAQRELGDKLDRAGERLAETRGHVVALRKLLVGPSRYLVLAANNAEMTAGSGMPNSAGVAVMAEGDIAVSDFVPTSDLYVSDGVAVPDGLDATYSPMGFGFDFRGTTAMPDFPTTAPVLAAMAAASPLGPVDGVLVVDAFTLQELLTATGPVSVAGIGYSADNVVDEILNRNYLRFDERDDRDERLQLQSQIARATFEALKGRPVELAPLAGALGDLARSRHLLGWAADPDVQALWEAIGADGAVRPADLAVSAENYDGDKIDYYLQPILSLEVLGRLVGGGTRVRMSVSIENQPRQPTSGYVEGFHPERHFVFLDVQFPVGAYDIAPLGFDFTTVSDQRPHPARTFVYPVFAGEVNTVSADFSLPGEDPRIVLTPGARVKPTVVVLNGDVAGSDAVHLPLTLSPRDAEISLAWGFAGVVLGAGGTALLALARRRRAAAESVPTAELAGTEPARRLVETTRWRRLGEAGWWTAIVGAGLVVVQAVLLLRPA